MDLRGKKRSWKIFSRAEQTDAKRKAARGGRQTPKTVSVRDSGLATQSPKRAASARSVTRSVRLSGVESKRPLAGNTPSGKKAGRSAISAPERRSQTASHIEPRLTAPTRIQRGNGVQRATAPVSGRTASRSMRGASLPPATRGVNATSASKAQLQGVKRSVNTPKRVPLRTRQTDMASGSLAVLRFFLRFIKRNQKIFTAILTIMALLVGGYYAWLYIRGSLDTVQAKVSAASPAQAFTPVACSGKTISATFAQNAQYAGQAVDFSFDFTNTAKKVPCYFDPVQANIQIKITSGEEQVWDSLQCKVLPESKQLLLDAGLNYEFTLQWDGIAVNSACVSTVPAAAGTYQAKLYAFGAELGTTAFNLVDLPAPPPSANNSESAEQGE